MTMQQHPDQLPDASPNLDSLAVIANSYTRVRLEYKEIT